MGPLKVSLGLPIRKEADDDLQKFQFTFGGTF
jgi:outer membrane protein insertion porin family